MLDAQTGRVWREQNERCVRILPIRLWFTQHGKYVVLLYMSRVVKQLSKH